MLSSTCSTPGCGGPVHGRGLCSKHYQYTRTTTGFADQQICSVDDCWTPAAYSGLCSKHYQRRNRLGSTDLPVHVPVLRATSWGAVHMWLRTYVGKATEQTCVGCGKPAAEWSFAGCDDAQVDATNGLLFCGHQEHYVPRCKVCHRGHDISGENNGRARVTADQVRWIREHEGEFTQQAIADRFGITQAVVSKIQRRVTWKHIV